MAPSPRIHTRKVARERATADRRMPATSLPAASLLAAALLAPALLAAQSGPGRLDAVQPAAVLSAMGASRTAVAPDHADHADLHAPAPLDAAVALIALGRIERLERDADALCRAAELALTAGLLSEPEADRLAWFRRGEDYGRQAERLSPDDPEALFMVAAAVGLTASHGDTRGRIRAANEVLALSRRILELDPGHPGGLHLRGALGAEAMRLNPMVRFLVERVLGGEALADASWEAAESDLRRALAVEPDNPAHRIELALLLRDTGRLEAARAQLRLVTGQPGEDALTAYHRERARTLLAELRRP